MKFHNIFRRSLSLLLCLCMLLGMGVTAFATVGTETRAKASDFASNKKLTDGGDTNPESYVIDIDAIVNGSASDTTVGVPLDVAIVFDRSDSMSFPANTSQVKTFTSKSAMNTYLNGLNKNLWDGYYRVTNISESGARFYSVKDTEAEKYISWEALRYNKTTKKWETFITTTNGSGTGLAGNETPHGVQPDTKYSYAGYFGYWVTMDEAYDEFQARKKGNSKTNVDAVKFSIAIPRLTVAQLALENFINKLNDNASKLASGNHTVSVVSYGGTLFEKGFNGNGVAFGSHSSEEYPNTCTATSIALAGSRATTAQNTAKNNFINNIIKNQYLWSTTQTNWGMEALTKSTKYMPAKTTGRNRVAILLTDGVPTDGMLFNDTIANGAIAAAKTLKASGATVYTLSFMEGISPGNGYVASYATGSENQKAHNFLHLVSSNYPTATNVTTPGNKTSGDKWMADNGQGNELLGHMQSILEKIVTEFKTPLTGTNESVALYDEITREFKIDESKPVKVYVQKYNGNGSYGAKSYIGSHSVKNSADWNGTSKSNVYKLYWDCALNSGKPAQSGVDLDISSVRLNWIDAKYAAIREKDVDVAGAAYADYKKGYKIGMEIPIVVDRNNTLGGNNIPTNTDKSGLYASTTTDTAYQTGSYTNYIKYPIPNANVQASFSTVVYDYFMDLETMVANLNAGVNSSFAQAIFAAMLQDPSTLLSYLNNNKNDYVNLSITLEDLYALLANAGADAFTATGAASGASFNYTIDQILDAIIKLTYTSNKTDSVGVAPFQNVSTTMHPNYYGPKYVVVDFDETVKTPLDKEGGLSPALQSGVTNGKIEGSNICYNFRANYASGAKSYLEKNYTTVKYQVTAINGTKPASGTDGVKTVKRNFHVIPANVMTYDDTFLSFINGGWETVGTYTDSEQSHDNAVIHGYDALYNSTYSKDYYHNALKAVTVSSAKSTAQATFNFTGTGFDIFAQTSPNSGTLVVEVCTDSAFKNVTKTYLVDTYLKDATLNQIPVVRLDGLTYGTWYVRITAFYDKVFDHNYTKSMRGAVPTEEKLREMLGIAADADFTFVPSASGYDHQDTRAIANAKNGQYNVYIDGIRVYNTLGTGLNAVATYAYALAGEGVANILNINDALVDASNANTWADSAVSGINGVLYTAASNSTSTETAVTDGIILGLEGALYTRQDGSKFYVFKDAACTQNIKYNGKNVYYRKQTLTSPNNREYEGLNYYYDGGSASTPMTMTQVREAFGSMPVYYNAKYSQYGPEKEVYLNGTNGVAFKVGTGAKKVMISLKSNNGSTATLNIYNPTTKSFAKLAATTSRVEMYYDITSYVNGQGYIYLKNAGGITAVCNIKTMGATSRGITVDRELMAWVQEIDHNTLPVDDSTKIMHSLDLASDIALNYVVSTEKLADYDRSYMEVSFKGETFCIEPEIRGDYGYFTVEGITAVDMTEKLTATVHMFLGEEEFVSETDVYCVADYAYAQLNKAGASDALKAVCANLLRYGAEAQSFKGNENAPADEAMTAEHKAYLTDPNTVSVSNKAEALGDVEGGIAWAGKALVLDSKVAVKAVFDLNGFTGNMEELNLRVSYTNAKGETVNVIIDTAELYNEEKGYYAFVLDTLLASEMRTVLTMALYEGDAQASETLLYSVESYCASAKAAVAQLGKTLLAYSDAAKAYFAN